jgi:hypothetical protein
MRIILKMEYTYRHVHIHMYTYSRFSEVKFTTS